MSSKEEEAEYMAKLYGIAADIARQNSHISQSMLLTACGLVCAMGMVKNAKGSAEAFEHLGRFVKLLREEMIRELRHQHAL